MIKGKDGVERPQPRAAHRRRLRPEEETSRLLAAIARHYLAERAEGESFRDFVRSVGAGELRRVAIAAAPSVI